MIHQVKSMPSMPFFCLALEKFSLQMILWVEYIFILIFAWKCEIFLYSGGLYQYSFLTWFLISEFGAYPEKDSLSLKNFTFFELPSYFIFFYLQILKENKDKRDAEFNERFKHSECSILFPMAFEGAIL